MMNMFGPLLKKNALRFYVLTLILLLSFVIAHHSHNAFDEGTLIELSGVVEEVNYRNPHVEIILRVGTDDPETEEVESVLWEIDTVSATGASRHKLRRDTIQEGDPLRAYGWPLNNGESVIYGGRLLLFEDSEAAIEANQSFIREDFPDGVWVIESVEDGKTVIPFDEVVPGEVVPEASTDVDERADTDSSTDVDEGTDAESVEATLPTKTFMFRQTLW